MTVKERSYDFTVRPLRGVKHTKQQILDSLKDYSREKRTSSFTHQQYDAWERRILCSAQISERFDGWYKAMQEAGLEPKWTPAKEPFMMIDVFKDCWEENKDPPTDKIFINYLKKINSDLTINMYKHHFGGLYKLATRVALHAAGKISEHQLAAKDIPTGRIRKPISLRNRYQVLTANNKCVICGRSPETHDIQLEIDHKKPVCDGGTNDIDNLQVLCFECNRGKAHLS